MESDVPVAVHEDLRDKGQTVRVPVEANPPVDTGVADRAGIILSVMLASGAGAAVIFRKRVKGE